MKKLVCGKGINDADYSIYTYINGKRIECPYYSKWSNMLKRCYSPEYQESNPTYKGCTVAEEWHSFMNFRVWMESQAWKGLHLDKDMLIPGNKIYSPAACMFISRAINNLLNDSEAAREIHPQGVVFRKDKKKFQAAIRKNGKAVFLGYHSTPEQAESAYIKAKVSHIRSVAEEQIDRLAEALRRHAMLIEAKLV